MNTIIRTALYFFSVSILLFLLSPLPLAISNPLIAVDVGHSKHTYGALSAGGISEFHFNFNLAKDIMLEIYSKQWNMSSENILKEAKRNTLK